MASLRNAQRISYKATYCQISPAQTATVSSVPPTGKLSRAVEKTAFVQSLRIVASELAALRSQSASASKASLAAEYQAQMPDARRQAKHHLPPSIKRKCPMPIRRSRD